MITKEELDKTLEAYETKNLSNEKARDIDTSIKKYVSERFDALKLELSQGNEKQLNTMHEKMQLMLKHFESAFKNSIINELNNLVVITKKSIIEQVLTETHEVIKNFMMQNSSQLSTALQGYNSRVKEDVQVSLQSLQLEVDKKIIVFNDSIKIKIEQEIRTGVHTQADNFSQTLTNKVTEEYIKIVDLIQNFKSDLTIDLDKKIVDKQSVEAKFQKIEDELKSQIDKTIKYQVEQTRSMMEQYAKAEITQLSEEIRNKTTSIFDSME